MKTAVLGAAAVATGRAGAQVGAQAEEGVRVRRVFAINGSPRRGHNTATLCQHYLEGAKAADPHAECRLIHLADLDFKGCVSCLACKRKDERFYGRCQYKDALHPLLQELLQADAIALASPIYFGEMTGMMRCFMERLLFPLQSYEADFKTLAPRKMPVAMMYTMNVPKQRAEAFGFDERLGYLEGYVGRVFSPVQRLMAYNTYQFNDYSLYEAAAFPVEDKEAQRKNQWPQDCQQAFQLGQMALQTTTEG